MCNVCLTTNIHAQMHTTACIPQISPYQLRQYTHTFILSLVVHVGQAVMDPYPFQALTQTETDKSSLWPYSPSLLPVSILRPRMTDC